MDYCRSKQLKKDRLCDDSFCNWWHVDNGLNVGWNPNRIVCANALCTLPEGQDVYREEEQK